VEEKPGSESESDTSLLGYEQGIGEEKRKSNMRRGRTAEDSLRTEKHSVTNHFVISTLEHLLSNKAHA